MLSEVIERNLKRAKSRILYEMRQSGEAGIALGFHGEEGEVLRVAALSQEKVKEETKQAVKNVFKYGDVKLKVAYLESNFLFIVLAKK